MYQLHSIRTSIDFLKKLYYINLSHFFFFWEKCYSPKSIYFLILGPCHSLKFRLLSWLWALRLLLYRLQPLQQWSWLRTGTGRILFSKLTATNFVFSGESVLIELVPILVRSSQATRRFWEVLNTFMLIILWEMTTL